MRPELRIGCSGWNYKHWRGPFYPPGVPVRSWFDHYAAEFDTVDQLLAWHGGALVAEARA